MPSAPALHSSAARPPVQDDRAAAPASAPTALPAEPFGQTGVRQFFPRLLAWAGLTLGLATLAVGYRSSTFTDVVQWTGRDQRVSFVSGNGQVLVGNSAYSHKTFSDTGWSYNSGGLRRIARWIGDGSSRNPLGFESHAGPLLPDADSGFWVRVRWSTLAAVFMIQPVGWVIVRAIKRLSRRKAAE